jgi:type IV secretory pathway component VirB8
MQHTELVVVHQGQSGYVWLSTSKGNHPISASWVRTKAELAHYVEVRESYDPTMYTHQTSEVSLLSSSDVNQEYELSQSQTNKLAPINLLGAKGYRTVQVNSIFQLDSTAQNKGQIQKTHINLAQVSFTVTDHLFGDNKTITTPYTALVSWKYTGTPTSPSEMLKDWDGFQVTDYKIQQVLVGKS